MKQTPQPRPWSAHFAAVFILSLLLAHTNSASAAQAFQSPEFCGGCHKRQYQEWIGSSHAYAAVSPTFNALELVGNHFTGGDFAAHSGAEKRELFCQKCHTPVAVELDRTTNANLLPSFADFKRNTVEYLESLASSGNENAKTALRGNSCDVCHQAIGPEHTKDTNAFFYSGDDGLGGIANASFLFTGLNNYKFGPFTQLAQNHGHSACQAPEYGLAPGPNNASTCVTNGSSNEKGGYISDPRFCGSCHDVRPAAGENSKSEDQTAGFLRLENLFTEWKESPWAASSAPAPHFNLETNQPVSCQDCHMSTYPYGGEVGTHPLTKLYPVDTIREGSGPSRKVSSHYFTGVDISLLDDGDFGDVTIENVTVIDDTTGEETTSDVSFNSQTTLARKPYTTHTTKYLPNIAPESIYQDLYKHITMPIGQDQRRKDLLKHAVRMNASINPRSLKEGDLVIDVTLENIGAGHNVPSGFSQERQFWIGIEVLDANGNEIYKTGYLDGPLQELQKLAPIVLEPITLKINKDSLKNVDPPTTDANSLTYEQFEEAFISGEHGGSDKDLKFFGNEFKRRASPTTTGVEVFSPFLANEMDNTHSLEPFKPETFSYVKFGRIPSNTAFPLKVTATLNFRPFPPRFLKGLIDSIDAINDTLTVDAKQLPEDLLARNKVIEMARKEFTVTGDNSPYYAMISSHGRCMDIPNYSTNNQTGIVHLWSCHTGVNQDIKMKENGQLEFRNGACLSVKQADWNNLTNPNNVSSNLRVGIEPCVTNSHDRQIWRTNTDGRLMVEKYSSTDRELYEYCLQRTSFSIGGAGQLTLAACWDPVRDSGKNTRLTQQWFYEPSFRPIKNGYDVDGIERCLDMDANSLYTTGAKIQLWQCNGSKSQQWQVSEKGLLINAAGRCIDVSGSQIHDLDELGYLDAANEVRAKVQSWDCHEGNNPSNIGANQRWKFEAGSLRTGFNDDGRYYCLGPVNGATSNGTELTLLPCNHHQEPSNLKIKDEAFHTLLWTQ